MSIKRFNGAGLYSSKSIKVWDQVTTQNDFQSIATVIVPSGGQATITFSNIPQNFTHLQLRGIAKNTTGATNPIVTFNGDIATNYSWHQLYGDGASPGGTTTSNTGGIGFTYAGASQFSSFIMDILDYTSTTKQKTVRSLGGVDNNGSGYAFLCGGSWFNASIQSINSLTITTGSTTFVANSQFALYGIKAAS